MQRSAGDRIIGWKAIAGFLGCDVRTARRWEAERALPVRRLPGDNRSPVWADPAELRAWLAGPPLEPAESEVREAIRAAAPAATRRPRILAVAGGLALALAGAAAFLLLREPFPAAVGAAPAYAGTEANRMLAAADYAKASRAPAGLEEAVAAKRRIRG